MDKKKNIPSSYSPCFFFSNFYLNLNLLPSDYDVKLNRNNLHAHTYKLTGVDLRNITEVEAKIKESDLDYSLPTLFLAECVLVYMSTSKSSQLLQWIAEKFKSAFFINYEMVK